MLNHSDKALLSLDLARLDRDVDISIGEHDMRMREMDRESLSGLFAELEFKALQGELTGESSRASVVFDGKIEYACDPRPFGRGRDVCHGRGLLGVLPGGCNLCLHGRYSLPRTVEAVRPQACHAQCQGGPCGCQAQGHRPHEQIFDTMLAAYCCDAATGETTLETWPNPAWTKTSRAPRTCLVRAGMPSGSARSLTTSWENTWRAMRTASFPLKTSLRGAWQTSG